MNVKCMRADMGSRLGWRVSMAGGLTVAKSVSVYGCEPYHLCNSLLKGLHRLDRSLLAPMSEL
jgi:hypothetical protein